MLYSKACPRCSGDIKLDRDNFGVYAKCLQCGFNRDFVTKRENSGSSQEGEFSLPAGFDTGEEQREAA